MFTPCLFSYTNVSKHNHCIIFSTVVVAVVVVVVVVVVCFLGVTTHCGCIFHSPEAGFSLLVFEVS
jgi:hypothetical protein